MQIFPFLSKGPNQFFDVAMYKLFGYFHEVDSHKKSSQSDLALERFCVTQCG